MEKINTFKKLMLDIESYTLSDEEISFLSNPFVAGVILFSRNIKTIYQTQKLTSHIKKLFKDKNYPILIDEEGSTVSRLRNLINHDISANYFANLYLIDNL